MKKILVLSFFPAFVPPRSGGELRLFHIYRELTRYYRVALLSSTFHGVPEERVLHGRGFVERRVPKCDRFHAEWQRLEAFASGGDMSAVSVASAGQFGTPMHRAYLEEYVDADIVIHDSPFTVPYDLFIGLDSKPRVYNSYNCESVLSRQLHPDPRSAPLHEIVDRCERSLVRHADLVTYCAEPDLRAFESLLGTPMPRTLELPNGLVPRPVREPSSTNGPRPRAVFVGSAHRPNVDAALYVALELAPAVPEVDFDIVGACLPAGSYAANVVRHGQVDAGTKELIVGAAAVGLNPMSSGGGSNLKVLEFFGAGLPVLSTAFGIRGYEVEHAVDCIVAERDGFAQSLADLVRDPERMHRIGLQGKKTTESRYSWSAIATRFREAIEALPRAAGRLMDSPFVLGMNDYDPFVGTGGGAIRIQGLTLAVDHRQPVVYLCFGDDDRLVLETFGTQSIVFKIPKTAAHSAEVAETNAMFWVSVADIVAGDHAPRNPILRALYAALRHRAATITMDHVYMVGLPEFFEDSFVYSSQNNESILKRAALEFHPMRDRYLGAVERAEDLSLRSSSLVVAVSEEDAHSFQQGRDVCAPIVVVRNGARPPAVVEEADGTRAATRVGKRSVVFVGSAHMPNVESCRFIVERLAPALLDTTFHLIGAASQSLPVPTPSNVVVWGSVSESLKSAILSRCTLAVNPMFSGSGSNIKLADCLGHGLHVVTTPFGRRGYPPGVDPHVTVVAGDGMADALRDVLDRPTLNSDVRRAERRNLFTQHLAMSAMAEHYAELVAPSQRWMYRVLFVTYRWVWPTRGGAEAHLLQHLISLSKSGQFMIDVVAPNVAEIADLDRFTSRTESTDDRSAPIDIPNLRYRRFPTQTQSESVRRALARAAWEQQPAFERAVYQSMAKTIDRAALGWGWGGAEGDGAHKGRWGYSTFGLHLAAAGRVQVKAISPQSGALIVIDHAGRQLLHVELAQLLTISFLAPEGEIRFEVSAPCRIGDDLRPLGIYVHDISVNGESIDLGAPPLATLPDPDANFGFERLHLAAALTRAENGIKLTEGRGPHSSDLERFLDESVTGYDLVLTHNTVFRTARVAIEAARQAGVPVAVLPHAHLDDDYYHFPDVTGMAVAADLVLAAPRAACEFYRRRGAKRVLYMTPGCDTGEAFTPADEAAFRNLWPSDAPFVLVLGRKSGAKGYHAVISAVEQLVPQHRLAAVLIGPDDDGVAITSPAASYLGPQPRQVLRGALRACVALVNMSTSESFGMVLLEAWLAGKPVIVNKHCAAFADLAEHGVNALMVDESSLAGAIEAIMLRPEFAAELGANGRTRAQRFDQAAVDQRFVEACLSLCEPRASQQPCA